MKFEKLFSVQDKDSGAGAGSGAAAADSGAAATGGAASGTGSGAAAGGGAAAGAGTGGGSGAGAGDAAGTRSAPAAGADGAAAAGAADKGSATGAGDGAAAAQPSWDADHWRGTWAGNDDKKKAWADRRTDIKVALDSAFQADQKIAELSAVAKTVLPKDATPEQIAAYRKDNGIPDKAEGYIESLPAEVKATLDDQDKAILTPYLSLMQKHNLSPQAAAEFMGLRQAEMDRWAEERVAADAKVRQQTEDSLRGDWGSNYRAEINNINNMLSGAPQEVRDMLFDARLPDGRGALAVPETLRWFAQLARMTNPYQVPVGGDGGSLDAKGVDGRINEIEGWMGAKPGSDTYNKYWKSDKVQGELRELYTARDNMKKRTAA